MSDADEIVPLVYGPEQREYCSHTKAVAECFVLAANRQHGMLTTGIRPAGIFGEGDLSLTKRTVGTPQARKLRIQIGDGTNKLDFAYVGNTASAHVLAVSDLQRAVKSSAPVPPSEGVDGEAFFVTNGEPIPFWDFARTIEAAARHLVKNEGIVRSTTFGAKNTTFSRSTMRFACMTRSFRIDKTTSVIALANGPIPTPTNLGQGADASKSHSVVLDNYDAYTDDLMK
ncbi:hypothetical protein MMC17_009068 [Xylographa soralifera]|nr:hypothetical protein [Xylographa soralifera]